MESLFSMYELMNSLVTIKVPLRLMLTHLFQSSISYLCSGLRGGLIPAEFSKTEGVRLSFANPLNPSSIES